MKATINVDNNQVGLSDVQIQSTRQQMYTLCRSDATTTLSLPRNHLRDRRNPSSAP